MVAPPTWPTDGSGSPVVVPCPLRETDCGLPKALSEMLRTALSVPTSEGLNLMLTTQLELAASVAGGIGQVFVSPKSAVLVPAMAMEVIVSAAVPGFVTVLRSSPTRRSSDLMVAPPPWPTDGSGSPVVVPCPLRETDCGLPKALSEMLRTALSVPTSEGLNLM